MLEYFHKYLAVLTTSSAVYARYFLFSERDPYTTLNV